MFATDTRDALLAAIIANPNEDTPRLAYADWLDEHSAEERVKCGKCSGSGITYSGCGYEELDCPRCEATGYRHHNPNAKQAEFIRLQCDINRFSSQKLEREKDLLSTPRDWFDAPPGWRTVWNGRQEQNSGCGVVTWVPPSSDYIRRIEVWPLGGFAGLARMRSEYLNFGPQLSLDYIRKHAPIRHVIVSHVADHLITWEECVKRWPGVRFTASVT